MLKRFQSRDASIFLICFLLAFFIWLVIVLNTEKVYLMDLPVQYSVEENQILLNDLPATISISSEGEVSNLIRFQYSLRKKPIRFFIDENKPLDLKAQNDQIVRRLKSYELQLIQNHNGEINLELDSLIEKRLPVKSQVSIATVEPYRIIDQKISPDRILVKGPSSILFYIDSISTSKTEIKNLTSDFEDSIYLVKSLSNKLEFEQEKVSFKTNVEALYPRNMSISFEELGYFINDFDSLELIYKSPTDYQFDFNDIDVSILPIAEGMDTFIISSNNKQIFDLIALPY